MNRITSLGKVNRLKLNQYFCAEFGLTERSRIQSFMKAMDVDSKDYAYETMQNAYNNEVVIFNRKIKQEKKTKKNAMKTIIEKLNKLKIVVK